jgi:hypothetical protein
MVAALVVGQAITLGLVTAAAAVRQVMQVLAVMVDLQEAVTLPLVLEGAGAAEVLTLAAAGLVFTDRAVVARKCLVKMAAEAALVVLMGEMLVITLVEDLVEVLARVSLPAMALYVLYGLEQLVNSHLPA